ncbi:hypothetical protein [Scytonema sp. HK-05]|uniref:hypothetical protein n=1 Tax=Scytonema sp. HK-05 TaxID=1137095 RepID=UPI0018E98457|nr:hypothetical protein [Scytonema sp. HK-05]
MYSLDKRGTPDKFYINFLYFSGCHRVCANLYEDIVIWAIAPNARLRAIAPNCTGIANHRK